MERTRLRELTHLSRYHQYLTILCRNGAYPIKGIDTRLIHISSSFASNVEMERTRLRELTHSRRILLIWATVRRNGAYPIKGIDTQYHDSTYSTLLQ